MTKKQSVQILVDNHTYIILELHVLKADKHLRGYESAVRTISDNRIREIRTWPHIWIIRAFSLSATYVIKMVTWLNQLGRDEIDVKRLEASHNQHLGLRIRGMDR